LSILTSHRRRLKKLLLGFIYDTEAFGSKPEQDRYLIRRSSDNVTNTISINDIKDGSYETWLAGASGYIVEWYNGIQGGEMLNTNIETIQMILNVDGSLNNYAQAVAMQGAFSYPLEDEDIIFSIVLTSETNNNNQRAIAGLRGAGTENVFGLCTYGTSIHIKSGSRNDNISQASFPVPFSTNYGKWFVMSFMFSGNVVTRAFMDGVEQTLGAGGSQSATFWGNSGQVVLGAREYKSNAAGKQANVRHFSALWNSKDTIDKVHEDLMAVYGYPPVPISDISASYVFDTSLFLTWSEPESMNGKGIAVYEVYVDGVFYSNFTGKLAFIENLVNGQSYDFTVYSVNVWGVRSLVSSVFTQQINGIASDFDYTTNLNLEYTGNLENLNDSVGTNHLTQVGTILYYNGKVGKYTYFGNNAYAVGTSDEVYSLCDGAGNDIAGQFYFWHINANQYNYTKAIASKFGTTDKEWMIYHFTDYIYFRVYTDASNYLEIKIKLPLVAGQTYSRMPIWTWVNYGFSFNPSGTGAGTLDDLRAYESGQDITDNGIKCIKTEVGTYTGMQQTAAKFYLGSSEASPTGHDLFTGGIDEFKMYKGGVHSSEYTYKMYKTELSGEGVIPSVLGAINDVSTDVVYDTSIVLNWSIPSLNGGVISRYIVYVDGVQYSDTPTNDILLTGLTENQAYTFSVKSEDTLIRLSPQSNLHQDTIDGQPNPIENFMVAHYALEGDLTDETGNHNMTGIGTITYQAGAVGQAAQFGSNSLAYAANHVDFHFCDGAGNDLDATIMMHVAPPSISGTLVRTLFCKRGTTDGKKEYHAFIYLNQIRVFIASQGAQNSGYLYKYLDITGWTNNQLRHVAIRFDGTGGGVLTQNDIHFFEDGIRITGARITDSPVGTYAGMSQTDSYFSIASGEGSVSTWDLIGGVDEVKVIKGVYVPDAYILAEANRTV